MVATSAVPKAAPGQDGMAQAGPPGQGGCGLPGNPWSVLAELRSVHRVAAPVPTPIAGEEPARAGSTVASATA